MKESWNPCEADHHKKEFSRHMNTNSLREWESKGFPVFKRLSSRQEVPLIIVILEAWRVVKKRLRKKYQPQQNSSKMQIHPYHSESYFFRMFNNDIICNCNNCTFQQPPSSHRTDFLRMKRRVQVEYNSHSSQRDQRKLSWTQAMNYLTTSAT